MPKHATTEILVVIRVPANAARTAQEIVAGWGTVTAPDGTAIPITPWLGGPTHWSWPTQEKAK